MTTTPTPTPTPMLDALADEIRPVIHHLLAVRHVAAAQDVLRGYAGRAAAAYLADTAPRTPATGILRLVEAS